jgi:hypothetical protein
MTVVTGQPASSATVGLLMTLLPPGRLLEILHSVSPSTPPPQTCAGLSRLSRFVTFWHKSVSRTPRSLCLRRSLRRFRSGQHSDFDWEPTSRYLVARSLVSSWFPQSGGHRAQACANTKTVFSP